jgi:hypothetical protein
MLTTLKQEYNSTFIARIVQPQQGVGASAYILDTRNIGVSNTEMQAVCSVFQPTGTLYFHEGVLFNPLPFALAKDALVNRGPENLSRIDRGKKSSWMG